MKKLTKSVMSRSILCVALLANAGGVFAQGDATRGEKIYNEGLPDKGVPTCMSCHGANGNSGGGMYPKLAGMPEQYLYKQLKEFADPKLRNNAIMSPYVKAMDESQRRDVAAYLAKQAMKVGAAKTLQGKELGQKIYRGGIAAKKVPACAACHGPTGAGMPALYPRLGGQWAEYTSAQLKAFQQGVRNNNVAMSEIAKRLSEEEINAVSDYIAGLH